MKLFVLLTTVALLSIAAPGLVLADHATACTTSEGAVAVGEFYVIPDAPAVYQESNGVPGAQRGGENSDVTGLVLGPDVFPQCTHPDTIVL